jgi:hypothetical protein
LNLPSALSPRPLLTILHRPSKTVIACRRKVEGWSASKMFCVNKNAASTVPGDQHRSSSSSSSALTVSTPFALHAQPISATTLILHSVGRRLWPDDRLLAGKTNRSTCGTQTRLILSSSAALQTLSISAMGLGSSLFMLFHWYPLAIRNKVRPFDKPSDYRSSSKHLSCRHLRSLVTA